MADLSENLTPPDIKVGSKSTLIHADGFQWMADAPAESIHAIVTDPPYGVKEFHPVQLAKKDAGKGGLWRLPPSFDGNQRSPVPRFTALNAAERQEIADFFLQFGRLAYRILKPGGHLMLASNAFLSLLVFEAIARSGLEFRGEVVRLVRTLRGGDRPKNYEKEYPGVCSMPRGHYEPWGLFRKPTGNLTVGECLKLHGTGGLRRLPNGNPFPDVISSERTPTCEKELLQEIAEKLGCVILAVEVMPEHVHLLLNCPPTLAPDQIMFRIKGYSARVLRQEFEPLRRMPSMWTRSYFCSTAGNVSSETIKRYIANQKTT